jgi:hypothetical protein
MCGLLDKDEYLKEIDNTSHQKLEMVKNLVFDLKKVLKPHWEI